jgi:O-antigen ligase
VGILVAAAVRLAWAQQGSIAAADWLSSSMLFALVVATVLVAGVAARPSPAVLACTGLLVALALWDAASATWAPSSALARDEALLVLTYALALLLPSLTLQGARDGVIAVGLVVAALAATTLAAGVRLFLSGGSDDFHDGRLNFPIGYPNAQAALALVGFWPAVAFAAGRSWPIAVRAGALSAACALLACWTATQSKGGALGLVVSALVVLAVARGRLRLSLPLLLSVVVVAAAFLPLTEPYRTQGEGAYHGVGAAILLVALVGAIVGTLYAALDGRVHVSAHARRIVGQVVAGLVVAAVVIAVIAFAVAVGSPSRFVHDQWQSFKRLPAHETGQTHLLTIGSNRYDFWRVALDELDRHPVAGDGARGFQQAYLLYRKSPETPARAHSLELDALSETGLVGFALLGAAFVALATRIGRRARGGLLSAGLLGSVTYFLTHASVDWIWTFPAVTIPFFLLVGIALATDVPERLGHRPARVSAAVAALVALFAFAPPWLSARFTAYATASETTDPFSWARRLDPLSTEPLVAESSLAANPIDAVTPLEEAVAKEPRSAALHYVLALALRRAGRPADARRELMRAQQLDPDDPLIRSALRG